MPINHKLYLFLIERAMPEGLLLDDQCEFIINKISGLERKIMLLKEKADDAFDSLDPHPPAISNEVQALHTIEDMLEIIRKN